MSFEWSHYQKAIFEEVQLGQNNLIVNSLAGSGKSSTLVEALKYVDPKLTTLFCAFNKKIADELKRKVPDHVQARTIHSLGLASVKKAFPEITIDNSKTYNIINKMFDGKPQYFQLISPLLKIVSLAKGHFTFDPTEIDDIIDNFDIQINDDIISREEIINHVLFILGRCKKDLTTLDFDDMVFLPNALSLKVPTFDRIFVDEAQDLANSQHLLLIKCIRKITGKCVVVADVNQAIYFFRGADEESIPKFTKELNAKELPLNISYRCPKAVIREAKKLVPAIEAAPGAIEGEVNYVSTKKMLEEAKPGCFVISRTNAPLIRICLNFLSRNIRANIQGKNVGEGLISILKRSRAKRIEKVLLFIDKWEISESKRMLAKKKETNLIKDKAECLRILAKNAKNMDELKTNITNLFVDTDPKNIISCGSTHALKGLEADTVWMLTNTYSTVKTEERNCKYIAITRSKRVLNFCTWKQEDL